MAGPTDQRNHGVPGMAALVGGTLVVLGTVAVALTLWRVVYALLLGFGGILVAILLRGVAGVARKAGLGPRLALAAAALAIVAVIVIPAFFFGPAFAEQFGELRGALEQGFQRLREYLDGTGWGSPLLDSVSESAQQSAGNLLGEAARLAMAAIGGLGALVLVLFGGLYFAADPRLYVDGFVRLMPRRARKQTRTLLGAMHDALWRWLVGQFVQMVVVGALTAVGLLAIGVPLPFALGFITGLLDFVPYLGPIAAAIPVLLVAFTVDPQTVVYAGLLFLAIQQVEGHLVTPLVQRWAVELPPALVILTTVASSLLLGLAGAIFATPLLVVVVVAIRVLYPREPDGSR